MAKIYLITSGNYSDYSVWGVCSTKKKAEQTIKILDKEKHYDDFRIEEFTLDFIDQLPPGHEPWRIEMDRDGNVDERFCHVNIERETILNEPRFFTPYNHIEMMEMTVAATDLKHAIKIVNEKRAQLVAMDKWGKNV